MRHLQQRKDVQVSQDSMNWIRRQKLNVHGPFIAQIMSVYSDRNACDILTPDGATLYNIPVKTIAGLIAGEPYGTIDLPAVDDYVIVSWASYGERHKMIIGTFIPYLTNEFNADAVNSGSKQFTKKLLEEGTELHYKRIFKSGTSVEVEEDGTIVIETPSGAYVLFDEDIGEIQVKDPHGNDVKMTSSGMVLTDANGNDITMAVAGVSINGNLDVAP